MLTPQQIEARARFRQYLGDTYGADNAALIMNIADLESNFRADATNRTSSAAGLTQITSGHWATLSESIRQKINRGEMTADQLPSGMTPENVSDFNKHKFDEISSAFMTRENIDFLGKQFVKRANAQRAVVGKPAVANMRELTGGNTALESFMIAGGHKDGWGVNSSGVLEGTGFGAAIKNGEIDLDNLMSSYAQNRERNERAGVPITDGMGHGITYAMFASDNVMETAGGPKLQLSAQQIKTGLALKQPNVSVNNRLSSPWIDRAQQLDPGFEPNDETLSQWLPRLDLADATAVAGANDIVSTNVVAELNDPRTPRATRPAAVAAPESRAVSEDPSIAARAASRLGSRIARGAEDAFGATLEFLVPAAEAAELSGQPPSINDTPSIDDQRTSFSPRAGVPDLDSAREQARLPGGAANPENFARLEAALTDTPFTPTPAPTPELDQPVDLTGGSLDSIANFGADLTGGSLDSIANFGTPVQPYVDYQQGRVFSDYQQGLENVINDYNTERRLGSAELEAQALEQAAINQAQDQQDLALSLAPTFNLNSTPIQAFDQPSLANFATPDDPNRNIGNILPSNAQLQDAVDLSRLTPEDYQLAAAAQVAQRDRAGTPNDIINRARGTNLEEQADNLALGAIQQQLEGVQSGIINSENFQEYQALINRTNNFSSILSDSLVRNSRGQ